MVKTKPFACRTITVGDVSLNVVVQGHGPDVMLLHGFPDSHQLWRNQIPALVAAGYRVIAPDLRGFGDSDAPRATPAYAVPCHVADLVGILDALGIARVRLVGHDWGAVCGWALAAAHPERVDRYVAMSVGHPSAYARGGLMQKLKGYYVLLLQLRGLAEFMLRLGDWRLLRLITRYEAELPKWKAELSRPGRLTAAVNIYRANLGMIFPGERPRVKVPVLGIWSSRDIALSEKQMLMSADYVDAPWRYRRIEGANHWMPLDAPDEVNALLLDYLR
ncbi:MAG: alpha/beta fold hydrolase [Deltaproteobacteria bacterium]|nr:alpha/beta fold hydrolase [Deltaproteobacteria bacterium]